MALTRHISHIVLISGPIKWTRLCCQWTLQPVGPDISTTDSMSRTIIGYYGSIMSQAQYLVCCIDTHTCDKYVTRRDTTTGCAPEREGSQTQLQREFFLRPPSPLFLNRGPIIFTFRP